MHLLYFFSLILVTVFKFVLNFCEKSNVIMQCVVSYYCVWSVHQRALLFGRQRPRFVLCRSRVIFAGTVFKISNISQVKSCDHLPRYWHKNASKVLMLNNCSCCWFSYIYDCEVADPALVLAVACRLHGPRSFPIRLLYGFLSVKRNWWSTVLTLSLLGLEFLDFVTCWNNSAWWRHKMETFSAWLAICKGKSPVTGEFPAECQWHGALMFSLIYARINGWVKNRGTGDLRRHHAHYDVIVMGWILTKTN